MKALVTGANGLIGAHLMRELLARGWPVRAMVRASSRLEALQGLDAERVVGDVLEPAEALAPRFVGAEILFHTAAHFAYAGVSDADLHRTAVEGTDNVLRAAAAAGVRRVVVTSSSVVFGSSLAPVVQDETRAPGTPNDDGFVEPPYVAAKVAQDAAAARVARTLGLEVVFACPTMTLGVQATALGPSNGMVLAYLADPFRMTYAGGCNLVAARDVAAGHRLAAERGRPGEHYLLGSENRTWQEIHADIAALCGVDPPRVRINHTLAYCVAAAEEVRAAVEGRAPLTTRPQARMVGRHYWYSHAKAAALGFAPADARSTLADVCGWLAASPHVSRELRATMLLSADARGTRATRPAGSAA